MKGDNTEFSQKNKMNKVVYEQKFPKNTLSPFFWGEGRSDIGTFFFFFF